MLMILLALSSSAFAAQDFRRSVLAPSAFKGVATSYCANPGKAAMPGCAKPNACGIKALAPQYLQHFAGVPQKLLAGKCGQCVEVTGAAGTVKAQVIDSLVAPDVTIDLSEEALKKATGFASDKKPVSWKFVPCTTAHPRAS